jgi:flagellar P-ring protein FlgI
MRILTSAVFLLMLVGVAFGASRIKDITTIRGVRENQLVGYGLVVGLQGTGDSLKSSPFTEQSMRSMLDHLGVNVLPGAIKGKNVAAVLVTATLPPFVGEGERIDVTVSSIGDSTSLAGGELVMTPLTGVDDKAYAIAQGTVTAAGFSAAGAAEKLTKGNPTAGRVSGGALVERQLEGEFNDLKQIVLEIRNPDFATSVAIADAINKYAMDRFKTKIATEENLRTVFINCPQSMSTSRLVSEMGLLEIESDAPARIVIDEKSGTIVIGKNVKLSTIAVTHGNLTVRVTETPQVSQPEAGSNGDTVITPSSKVSTKQDGGKVSIIEGPSLQTLVDGLNQIGLKPDGMIAILQAIKAAGAIEGELIVQ